MKYNLLHCLDRIQYNQADTSHMSHLLIKQIQIDNWYSLNCLYRNRNLKNMKCMFFFSSSQYYCWESIRFYKSYIWYLIFPYMINSLNGILYKLLCFYQSRTLQGKYNILLYCQHCKSHNIRHIWHICNFEH